MLTKDLRKGMQKQYIFLFSTFLKSLIYDSALMSKVTDDKLNELFIILNNIDNVEEKDIFENIKYIITFMKEI